MISRLPSCLMNHLEELGEALDIGRPLAVFDGGQVKFKEARNQEVHHGKRQRTARSAAESRERQRAQSGRSPRRSGRWKRFAPQNPVLSKRAEAHHVDGLGLLISSYPNTGVINEAEHCWLSVPALPLGEDGPRAIFLILYPTNSHLRIKAWGFWVEGPALVPMGPRHTNYPDGTICAFPEDRSIWYRKKGITLLVDLFSEWAVRQLHWHEFGTWPGAQLGPTPVYRLAQFNEAEQCYCGSEKAYGTCHRDSDMDAVKTNPIQEHIATARFLQGVPFGLQRPPPSVMELAHTGRFTCDYRKLYHPKELELATTYSRQKVVRSKRVLSWSTALKTTMAGRKPWASNALLG